MADLLHIGSLALFNTQKALDTTGHNVANVNTEGYSRQRTESGALPARFFPNGYIGQGVKTEAIIRTYDDTLGRQVAAGTSAHRQQETLHELTSRLDQALSDPQSTLAPLIEGLFARLDDLANDPTSIANRSAVLNKAADFIEGARTMDREFRDLADEVEQRMTGNVEEVNRLAEGIAVLNRKIATSLSEPWRNPPNDLFDARDQSVKDLSVLIGNAQVSIENQMITVMVGQGHSLVQGTEFSTLATATDPDDPQQLAIRMTPPGGVGQIEITDFIQGGKLGGLLQFRDSVLDPARNAFGRTVVGLAETINAQHRLGMDLNGDPGADLFTLTPTRTAPEVIARPANVGDLTVTVADTKDLTYGEYELARMPANPPGFPNDYWQLTRIADGETFTWDVNSQTVDGLTITDGLTAPAAGDTYLLTFGSPSPQVIPQPTNTGAIAVTIDDVGGLTDETYALERVAGAWQLTRLSDDQIVTLASDATTPSSSDYLADGLRITETGSAPPVDGDRYLLRPTRDAPYNLELTTHDPRKLAAAMPLVADVATDVNGQSANLGDAAIGDLTVSGRINVPLASAITLTYNAGASQFNVSAPPGGSFAYDPAIHDGQTQTLFDPPIGGELSFVITGAPENGDAFTIDNGPANSGDNGNALALAGWRQLGVLSGGTVEIGRSYSNLVGKVGSQTRSAEIAMDTQAAVLQQSERRLDQVAGVNLDEEAANLLRFQQAYNAATQMIRVADETFQSLLGAIQ